MVYGLMTPEELVRLQFVERFLVIKIRNLMESFTFQLDCAFYHNKCVDYKSKYSDSRLPIK